MRIAHVSDFYLPRLGGIEMHVHDLAVQQSAAGHTVEVITTSPPRSKQDAGARTSRRHEGPIPVHRTVHSRLGYLHPLGPGRVTRAIRSGDYDVVHIHAGVFSPSAFIAAHATAKAGIPTVVTWHSLFAYALPIFKVANTLIRWTSWPIMWTAVSEVAAAPLVRLVGSSERVVVLPNGVDVDAWRVLATPRDCNDVLAVAVMRLASRKRPIALLRMLREASRLLPATTRLRAVIVGDGPQRAKMQRYLERHNMLSWVTLAGRRPRGEIRTLFSRADVFVAPAPLESFGIAALEARCAGLPVVARAESGVAGFIGNGINGILTETDAAMAQAIAYLAAHPWERTRMRSNNQATRPPISWADTLSRTWRVYGAAMALSGRDPLPLVIDTGSQHRHQHVTSGAAVGASER